jgi:hypothetical protein
VHEARGNGHHADLTALHVDDLRGGARRLRMSRRNERNEKRGAKAQRRTVTQRHDRLRGD